MSISILNKFKNLSYNQRELQDIVVEGVDCTSRGAHQLCISMSLIHWEHPTKIMLNDNM